MHVRNLVIRNGYGTVTRANTDQLDSITVNNWSEVMMTANPNSLLNLTTHKIV